jgi:hypothetical protein
MSISSYLDDRKPGLLKAPGEDMLYIPIELVDEAGVSSIPRLIIVSR